MNEFLLCHGANIKLRDTSRYIAILRPAYKGSGKAFVALLNTRTSCQAYNTRQETALMFASAEGNSEIVRIILEHGNACVNHRCTLERTALTQAARHGYMTIVKLLIRYRADGSPTEFENWIGFPFDTDVARKTKNSILAMVKALEYHVLDKAR
ncbi:hypothetical protein VTL71DRAFT_7137 [Oculimacula yallundae]|uniref:Ankyrin repeat protein n=1 Tax=Oculimacula yallundae TaxID=86028 RepID=A0ABR4BXI0_9HELO